MILLDLELIGVESLELSFSIIFWSFISDNLFNILKSDGSSICTIIEHSQLGQQFLLFSSVKQLLVLKNNKNTFI